MVIQSNCQPMSAKPKNDKAIKAGKDLQIQPHPQCSNGLPDAEEGSGEPSSAPAAEPVRFGWVKGVMVSAPRPAGES